MAKLFARLFLNLFKNVRKWEAAFLAYFLSMISSGELPSVHSSNSLSIMLILDVSLFFVFSNFSMIGPRPRIKKSESFLSIHALAFFNKKWSFVSSSESTTCSRQRPKKFLGKEWETKKDYMFFGNSSISSNCEKYSCFSLASISSNSLPSGLRVM